MLGWAGLSGSAGVACSNAVKLRGATELYGIDEVPLLMHALRVAVQAIIEKTALWKRMLISRGRFLSPGEETSERPAAPGLLSTRARARLL